MPPYGPFSRCTVFRAVGWALHAQVQCCFAMDARTVMPVLTDRCDEALDVRRAISPDSPNEPGEKPELAHRGRRLAQAA